MKIRQFIILLTFLWWAFNVRAQVPEELSTSSSPPEEWQLTLDVIKSKAQSLVVQNNGLQMEYRQLIGQVQKLQQSINDLQNKNDQLENFLKERHGRTDQQARIDELTRTIKAKKEQAEVLDGQLANLQRKRTDLEHKIQQLKYTISDVELHQQETMKRAQISQETLQPQTGDQLPPLRKQLEDEGRQEVLLENELGALKTGDKTQNLNADAIDEENKQLQARLDVLRLQKLRHEKESSDTQLSQAAARMYGHLRKRKDQLESDIYAYESRLDDLRQSSLMAMSWPLKKKKLVHTMVQMDSRNNQMRVTIKELHEDIDVLRDQVGRLERRLDFARGSKEVTFKSEP